jgi:DNA-binding CsgD family transcriptional regulator
MAIIQGRSIEPAECAPFGDAIVDALIACTKSNRMLSAFAELAASHGFSGFSYLLIGGPASDPQLLKHWSTAGAQWTKRYATRGYHAIDPRVTLTRNRTVPIVWKLATEPKEPRVRAFTLDADRHAIRSGIAWSIYDARVGRAVIAWDSTASSDEAETRQSAIRSQLAALALLAGFVHEAMLVHCKAARQRTDCRRLTARECQCVKLAAHGMTSADVAVKLGITERTANFHFGNVMSKLGALNRSEAIARAIASQIVSLDR